MLSLSAGGGVVIYIFLAASEKEEVKEMRPRNVAEQSSSEKEGSATTSTIN